MDEQSKTLVPIDCTLPEYLKICRINKHTISAILMITKFLPVNNHNTRFITKSETLLNGSERRAMH